MEDLYYGKVEVSIFLTTDITEEQRQALGRCFEGRSRWSSRYTYESQGRGVHPFRKIFRGAPDLVETVQPDTLPESFQVKLKDPTNFEEISDKYKAGAGSTRSSTRRRLWTNSSRSWASMQNIALVVAMVQGIAALLLVANTIQVAAYSKRKGGRGDEAGWRVQLVHPDAVRAWRPCSRG